MRLKVAEVADLLFLFGQAIGSTARFLLEVGMLPADVWRRAHRPVRSMPTL
jgi:hypothetical protein